MAGDGGGGGSSEHPCLYTYPQTHGWCCALKKATAHPSIQMPAFPPVWALGRRHALVKVSWGLIF